MSWSVNYNSTLGIIELVFVGSTTGPEVKEGTSKVIALAKEHGTLDVLVDTPELKLSATILDLYQLPTQYVEEGFDRLSRVALVLPESPKEAEYAEFYETVCVNRGWSVQLFQNRAEAIEWLKASDSSDKPDSADD